RNWNKSCDYVIQGYHRNCVCCWRSSSCSRPSTYGAQS
ncbi:unnamed protein product, partial [Ectocarpus sp. 8 AP-2014]